MFALLGSTIVAGVGSSNSGVPGKADLVVFGVLLLVAASYVHRLGRGSTTANQACSRRRRRRSPGAFRQRVVRPRRISEATLLTTLGTVETPRELRLRATTVTGRHPHSQPFERQLDCGLSCGDGENTSDVTAGHIRNPVLTVEALLARVRSMPGRSLYSTNGVYPCAGRP